MMQYIVNLSTSEVWTYCPLCGQIVLRKNVTLIDDSAMSVNLAASALAEVLDEHLCNKCPKGRFAAHLVTDMSDTITVLVGEFGKIVEIHYVGSRQKPFVTELTVDELKELNKRCHCISEYTMGYVEQGEKEMKNALANSN